VLGDGWGEQSLDEDEVVVVLGVLAIEGGVVEVGGVDAGDVVVFGEELAEGWVGGLIAH